MKHKFARNLGRVTENLELGLEEKWIYVQYSKGSIEKTACLFKNENKTEKEYLEGFLQENNVSEEMRKEVLEFLEKAPAKKEELWNEFSTFLINTVSLNMVFAISLAVCVYGGYKLGSILDGKYGYHPTLTIIGTFLGIGVGVLTVYSMVQRHFKKPGSKGKRKEQMAVNAQNERDKQYPIIDVTIDEVRSAVRKFSDNLPKGVYRTILVNDDNSIDFVQLAPLLGGIPSTPFYMSKETYDLFEESEKNIPAEMDLVQRAVDNYVKEHKEYPMLNFDPLHKVNYYQLMQEKYLKAEPEIQFYITDLDGLITHIKPHKKNSPLN